MSKVPEIQFSDAVIDAQSVDFAQFASVVERTGNAVVVTDAQGKVTWVNSGFERICGFTLEEALGKSPGSLLQGPKSDQTTIDRMKAAIKAGAAFDVVILNYKKNREEYWNHIDCQPFFDNGRLSGFMAIEVDATQTVKFQNQLIEANKLAAENAERLTLAFASGQVGSWDWNPSTDELYFHESWERLVGVEPGTLEHKLETWLHRIHPDDVSAFIQKLAEISRDNLDEFSSEHRLCCEQNYYRWTMARGQVVSRDERGQPTRVVGVHLDISEQKRNQQLLDQQNDLLRGILNVIPYGVCWKGADLRLLGCNKQFAVAAGYEQPEDVIGKSDRDFRWDCAQAELARNDDLAVIQTGISILHQTEEQTLPSGERKIVDTSKVPLKLKDGTTGLLGIFIDVTELESAREALRRKETELRHKGRMEAVGELAGGVAHEYNNLLQTIRGYVSFAMTELPQESSAHSDLTEATKAIDRAAELTQQLLNFSRLEDVQRKTGSPQLVMSTLKSLLRPLMPENITLKFTNSHDLPFIKYDSVTLVQALLNLCVNARDAMPEGGTLTLKTHLQKQDSSWGFVVFTVTDTGVGIPVEHLERIFDPFFTTKEVGEGTGLGLPMVYSTIKEHDGLIEVHSEVGQGTTFEIRIPVYQDDLQTTNLGSPTQAELTGSDPELAAIRTVLLAEDDPVVMQIAIRMLQTLGYRVITATNGLEALNLYKEQHREIDALVFDVMMPHMTGLDAYLEIRQLGARLPIIFCTGYDSNKTQKQQIQERGFKLISKPFDQKTLDQALRQAFAEMLEQSG